MATYRGLSSQFGLTCALHGPLCTAGLCLGQAQSRGDNGAADWARGGTCVFPVVRLLRRFPALPGWGPSILCDCTERVFWTVWGLVLVLAAKLVPENSLKVALMLRQHS